MTYEQWQRHDQWGNCLELLTPEDEAVLEAGTWFRAAGESECAGCGKPYYDHKPVLGALWLLRICDGNLVKL